MKHIETVHEGKQYQCQLCHEVFKSNYTLQNHIDYEHEGKEKFKCPTCTQQFTAKSTLNKHIAVAHQRENLTTYLCPHCGKSCVCKTHLTRHIKCVHENIASFQCNGCTRSFKSKSSRQRTRSS